MILYLAALTALLSAPRPEMREPFSLKVEAAGHLFTTAAPVRLTVEHAKEGDAFTLTISDSAGRPVPVAGREKQSPQNGMLTLPTLPPGWYRLSAASDDGQSATAEFAVARVRAPQIFRDWSPFGLAEPPKTQEEWKLCADMGVSWIHWALPWAYAEARQGLYWYLPGAPRYGYEYDDFVLEANKRGIRTMLQFRTTPLWASKGTIGSYTGSEERTDIYPPDDQHWDAFETFVGEAVKHYRPMGVRHFELWAEAEGSLFRRYETTKFPKIESYQKMMMGAKSALQANNPDALLIAPGDEPMRFLTEVESGYTAKDTFNGKPDPFAGRSLAGVGRKADIVAGHFYWTDWQSSPRRLWGPEEKNPGRLGLTLREMIEDAKKASGGRPVWNTEVGYGSAKSEETPDQMWASEDEQASLLVRYYLLSSAWGVEKTFWYCWKDSAATSYGLLRRDGTVKPAYLAYRAMTESLEGLKFDKFVHEGPEEWTLRFNGPRTVYVAWKTTPGTGDRTLKIPAGRVIVTNRDGARDSHMTNGLEKITLRGTEPVYLELEK